MDMHTHFLREDTPIRAFVAQREAVGKAGWNPTLVGKPQTIDDLMFPNYFKEIFLDSDTKVALHQRLVLGGREVLVPHQPDEVRRAREAEQGVRHAAHVLARHLHARAGRAGWRRSTRRTRS